MRKFTVTITGSDPFDLRGMCERFIDELWLAAHMTPEQMAGSALDHFKAAVASRLNALNVECVETEPDG